MYCSIPDPETMLNLFGPPKIEHCSKQSCSKDHFVQKSPAKKRALNKVLLTSFMSTNSRRGVQIKGALFEDLGILTAKNLCWTHHYLLMVQFFLPSGKFSLIKFSIANCNT